MGSINRNTPIHHTTLYPIIILRKRTVNVRNIRREADKCETLLKQQMLGFIEHHEHYYWVDAT